jgi:hypothetical protein
VRVLVGCERSGVVREAFRKRGHDAWSCDLVPADDGSEFHIRMDIRYLLSWNALAEQKYQPLDTYQQLSRQWYTWAYKPNWDLLIAHPDCRYLCNSGVLRLYIGGKKANGRDEARWSAMQEAVAFFRLCLDADIPQICVENPVMHGHAKALIGVEPSQSIQPWEFGEDASKRTCLWLKGLPLLVPTNVIRKVRYANQTPSGQNKLGPSPERSAIRAKTYQGPAEAMAEQWG